MSLPFRAPVALSELARRHGGATFGDDCMVSRIARIGSAGEGDLAPLLNSRHIGQAQAATGRGAVVLVSRELMRDARVSGLARWAHAEATWALAEVLDACDAPPVDATIGEASVIAPGVFLGPRVVIGARVIIEPGCVIGRPGFGWAMRNGEIRAIPQLGGVVIEDDVYIGPLTTVDAGTLTPTRIGRGTKLDAHCHVGHNCDVGQGCLIAAQTGLAGSVVIGNGAQLGGQVGVADHVVIGAGARVAAKSGVIGDVPAGAVMAGYPALPRLRWLRGLARLYKKEA